MTDHKALLELAERVEKASGPDRLLDAQIALALGIGPRGGPMPEEAQLYVERYPDCQKRSHNPGQYYGYLWGKGGMDGSFGWTALPFTASLDAAMTLVPEGLAGFDSIRLVREYGGKWWVAILADDGRAVSSDLCATIALALTAACLRALAIEGNHG